MSIADLIAAVPLYAHLSGEDRREAAAGLRAVDFADGEALIRQGEPPDGAYFLLSGQVRVLTKLPGGGETPIGEAGPGSTLGELALLRTGRRGATVRASGPVEALFADRRHFQAGLAQLRPAALQVARNLAGLLTDRLQQLCERIRAHVEAAPDGGHFRPLPAPGHENSAPAFDVDAFLPILPCLADFEPADRQRIRDAGTVLTPPPGSRLDNGCAYVVVRGAVTAGLADGRGLHQVAVIGPGRFCRLDPLIVSGAALPAHVVQEAATLLTLPAAAFAELFDGGGPTSQRFLSAVNEHQAAMVQRAAGHLTRLVGLSRLHRQAGAGPALGL